MPACDGSLDAAETNLTVTELLVVVITRSLYKADDQVYSNSKNNYAKNVSKVIEELQHKVYG